MEFTEKKVQTKNIYIYTNFSARALHVYDISLFTRFIY